MKSILLYLIICNKLLRIYYYVEGSSLTVKLQSSKLTSWVRLPPPLSIFLVFVKFVNEIVDFFFFNKYLRNFFVSFFGKIFLFKKYSYKAIFFFERLNLYSFFNLLHFYCLLRNKTFFKNFFYFLYSFAKNKIKKNRKNFFIFFRITFFFVLFLLFYLLFTYTLENIPVSKLFFV